MEQTEWALAFAWAGSLQVALRPAVLRFPYYNSKWRSAAVQQLAHIDTMYQALLCLHVLIRSNMYTIIVLALQMRENSRRGQLCSSPRAEKEQGMDLNQTMWFWNPWSFRGLKRPALILSKWNPRGKGLGEVGQGRWAGSCTFYFIPLGNLFWWIHSNKNANLEKKRKIKISLNIV